MTLIYKSKNYNFTKPLQNQKCQKERNFDRYTHKTKLLLHIYNNTISIYKLCAHIYTCFNSNMMCKFGAGI